MNFSTDRDLLPYEPAVFREVPFAAQQRIHTSDAVLEGTELSSVSADFHAAAVGVGGVVLLERTPLEVIERLDPQTLTVSQLRPRLSDDPIPPLQQGEDNDLIVRTFTPQAALVRAALLRMLGIDPDIEQGLSEEAVLSLGVMARLEALGTLERIYSGAAALAGENETIYAKAQAYRRAFREAVAGASVLIDVDGDGQPEERRHLGLIRLKR